jgi:hypothetical protein
MINDNILADKLNLFREGKLEETSEEEINDIKELDSNISTFFTILLKATELGATAVRSLAFGFAVKTVFVTDWDFVSFLAVGFVIEIMLSNTFNLFKQRNK